MLEERKNSKYPSHHSEERILFCNRIGDLRTIPIGKKGRYQQKIKIKPLQGEEKKAQQKGCGVAELDKLKHER